MSQHDLPMQEQVLLELRHVSKRFVKPLDSAEKFANILTRPFGHVQQEETVIAVDDVSLDIRKGEVVGLVGESGCGKSTLGRIITGLHAMSEGQMSWRGAQIDHLPEKQQRRLRLPIQMIFQDPYASLNPRLRVQDIVGEAPVVHGMVDAADKKAYVTHMLERVGLSADMLRRFPHQFSGGQRARVGIARALAVNPEFLVCDEAVAALDVSVQAQVLNLFIKLRDELHLTYLFISHDLGVVRHISDRVAIMYLGKLVEIAAASTIFSHANHPYTQALLESAPKMKIGKTAYFAVQGEIPSPLHPPAGCHFHPRCPHAMLRCNTEKPLLKEIAVGHFSACHLNDGL